MFHPLRLLLLALLVADGVPSLAQPVDFQSAADVYVRTDGPPPQIRCWVDSTLVTQEGLLLDRRAPVGEPMAASIAFACRADGDTTVCLQGAMDPLSGGFSLKERSQNDGQRRLTALPDGGLRLCGADGGRCTDYRRCPKGQASAMPGLTDAQRRVGPKSIEIEETLFVGLSTSMESAGSKAVEPGTGSLPPGIYGLIPLTALGTAAKAKQNLVASVCAAPFLVAGNGILATTMRRGGGFALQALVQCGVSDGALACRDTGRTRASGYFLRDGAAKPKFILREGGEYPILCNPQSPSNDNFCHALLACPDVLADMPIDNLDGTTLRQFVAQPPEIRP